MERLSTIHRSSIMPINLFDLPQSPKEAKSSVPSDWFETSSPQLRRASVLRKTIILPNGITLDEQLNLILAKPERTLAEAKILYEAIKDFPIIKMIFPQPGDKTFDMESILYLIRRIKLMKMNAGDIVYTQDDASNGQMYVVYSGEISLCIKDPDHITTQNYERFENEQKKRTMGKLGSSRKLNVNLKKLQTTTLTPNSSSRSKRSPRPGETPEPEQEASTEAKEKEEHDDHVFKLLKSYMTDNYMPQQTAMMPEKLGTAVENDTTTIKGITKAFVKFKKFLKNRSTMLNAAKNYGIIRDKLSIGAFFGTTIDLGLRKREETAFALKETELLVIEYKDLNHVKASFTKKRIALKNFMFDNFPKLDLYQSEKIVSGLLGTLEEKTFEGGSYIINEGQPGEHFYIVQSGTLEISKEIIIDEAVDNKLSQNRALLRVHPSVKKKVVLTSLSQGIFFGDELVFQAQKYFFTVKVTSNKATLVAINNKTFAARFPRVVFDSIKALYLSKTQHYLDILRTQLSSAQYENYDIASDLTGLSNGDKKAALDSMNLKDLWSPIRLKPKKKLASAIGSPVATPRLSPLHKATSGFSSPSHFEARSPMMMKDFSLGFGSGSNSPVKESTYNVMESREKLKNLITPTSPLNPIAEKKQKNWSALNSPTSQKEMLVKVNVLGGGNISQNNNNQDDGDEEMDRIRKSYKTRTAVNADSPLLKHINIQGKDGIAYLNSHKAPIKGPLDFKAIEEIDPKMQQTIIQDTSLEALKLGIRLSDPKKPSSLSSRKKESSKFKGGETSKNKEDNQEDIIESSQRDNLPYLLSSSSPKRIRAHSNAPESDGFRTSPIQLKPIKESSVPNNESEIPVIHSGLGRNRSMPDTTKAFLREVNIMDVPMPKETKEYLAKKKKQQLKSKERMTIVDGSQDDAPEKILSRNAPFFNKNEISVKTASAGGNNKDVLDLLIKGGSPKEKTVLPNLKVVNKYDSLIESYGNKSKDDAKKSGSIQWPDSQSILLKEKGKMHQQLRRKPLAKSFFQMQSVFGTGDLELKGSVKPQGGAGK